MVSVIKTTAAICSMIIVHRTNEKCVSILQHQSRFDNLRHKQHISELMITLKVLGTLPINRNINRN